MAKPTIVHVNRQFIAFNAKTGRDILPVYTAKHKGKTIYAYSVKFHGPCELVDPRERDQLKCGARAWIETTGEIEFIDPMSFADAKKLKENI